MLELVEAAETSREGPQCVGPAVPATGRSRTRWRRQVFDHGRGPGRAGRHGASSGSDPPRPPPLEETDLALRDACATRLGARVRVDNGSNLLTLAETWFGAGRALSDVAVVTIEHGGLGPRARGTDVPGARAIMSLDWPSR